MEYIGTNKCVGTGQTAMEVCQAMCEIVSTYTTGLFKVFLLVSIYAGSSASPPTKNPLSTYFEGRGANVNAYLRD